MNYLLNANNYDWSDPGSIPNLILKHFYLVGITMLISLIIAIPLGILVARYRQFYLPVITVAGVLYTIPGLAFIGILYTITHQSPVTVLIPLIVYTQIVLIRNMAAGINSVDPQLLEVGRAMGMTPLQSFMRITLPLALPTIVAGIRIATVTTIGLASLASLAGQSGLGDLVFKNSGAGTLDFAPIAAGGILMGLFAVLADLLLLGLQTLLNRGRGALSIA
jgi:osmoprotectant transport system permease protein